MFRKFSCSLSRPCRALHVQAHAINISKPAIKHDFETETATQSRARRLIADIDRLQPGPSLIDSFNRQHDYLRISLTERCNLRCFYCMPSEGVELSPGPDILSDDEIIRLASIFVRSGVTKIRLTGGEPTVRKNLVELVGRLRALRSDGLRAIAMTSNGVALQRKFPMLVENGLTHINLSLDTLDPYKFELMTRRPGHEAVLRSLDLALNCPSLQSVKLNVVVIRGLNDSEVPQFLELTREKPLSVRFIEFMPFTGNKWDKKKMLPSADLLSRITMMYPGVHRISDEANDTARSYKIPGYRGSFGFISSMSDHFCGSCNRLRLTADGKIKVCLFDSTEVSLRDLMRQGASDGELLQVIRKALGNKKEKHAGMEDIDVINNRPMILIGGQSRNPSLLQRKYLFPFVSDMSFVGARTSFTSVRLMSSDTRASQSSLRLTHIDSAGKPAMVDVTEKAISKRTATAHGRIYISKLAYDLVHVTSDGSSGVDSSDLHLSDDDKRRKEKARSKGDVLAVAQLAGIMASKRTSELIPLCHPIALSHISVHLSVETGVGSSANGDSRPLESAQSSANKRYSILCRATVTCDGKTGVEMEALMAVSASLLTVWDMLKAVAGREMEIGEIMVTSKSGGKNGDFSREIRAVDSVPN